METSGHELEGMSLEQIFDKMSSVFSGDFRAEMASFVRDWEDKMDKGPL